MKRKEEGMLFGTRFAPYFYRRGHNVWSRVCKMVVYKVFYKNYALKKGELIGVLIERREELRGGSRVDSGLRWAKFTFGHLIKDKQMIFVVPDELDLGKDVMALSEEGILTNEAFRELMKGTDKTNDRKKKGEDQEIPSS